MTDTVLIVDDEESVRRTFQEWLASSGLSAACSSPPMPKRRCGSPTREPIDLAVLDWNLGSGSDGLRLLEDLVEFRPDIVAILVTGFAHQATPLDALRMGVRDYLDKNADLNRETFLAAVRRATRQASAPPSGSGELNRSLAAFREAVEKVLPIVRTAAALNDPVPLPEAVKSLLRFVDPRDRRDRRRAASCGMRCKRRGIDAGLRRRTASCSRMPAMPFSRSLAASVVSFQEPVALNGLRCPVARAGRAVAVRERADSRSSPRRCRSAAGTVVVLELFDKPGPGSPTTTARLVAAAAEVGADLLRQALAERQTHRLLFDAVEAALQASDRRDRVACRRSVEAAAAGRDGTAEAGAGRGRERRGRRRHDAAAGGGGAGAGASGTARRRWITA